MRRIRKVTCGYAAVSALLRTEFLSEVRNGEPNREECFHQRPRPNVRGEAAAVDEARDLMGMELWE